MAYSKHLKVKHPKEYDEVQMTRAKEASQTVMYIADDLILITMAFGMYSEITHNTS